MNRKYTPEMITGPSMLPPNSIFVFGSNTQGRHGAGSAKTAMEKFGAINLQAHGFQGASYGIITTNLETRKPYPLVWIANQIDGLILEAKYCLKMGAKTVFYVTKFGTERAGYSVEEIALLWRNRVVPDNIILPVEFDNRPEV